MVPKLRFPEFHEAGAWDTAPGDALFQQIINRDAPPGLPILAITQEHGAIPRNMIDYNVSVTEKSLEAYKEVRAGDFIISLRSFQGGIEFSGYHGICSPAYVILRKRGRLSEPFYRQHFKSYEFIQQLTRNVEGLRDGKMISYKQFSELQLLKPTLPEQQKIADCLNSVDALIAAQGRKVEALKAHKKGLLEQLFPQEGETRPRLRFPEFEGTGEWQVIKLGNLLKASPDYGVSAAAAPYNADLPKYLRITDIAEDGRYLGENKVSVDINPTGGDYLDEGDIAIARTGASVGKSYRYRREDGQLVFAGFLIRVRPDQRKLLTGYLAHYMATPRYWDWISVNSARSGQPGINSAELSSLLVPLPADDRLLREQNRIAGCLTSLDDLTAAETRKLDMLKTHKKGLMQQLFPQVGEDDI